MFEKHVALVTGGGKGIGRAVVDRFIREGARVGVLVRSAADADNLTTQHGDKVVTHVGDVRYWQDNEAIVAKTVAAFGRLDTLIPNAGVYDFSRAFTDIPGIDLSAQFDELIDINVKGYLLATRAALEPLRASRGSVIFTLSSSSFYAGGGGVLYVTSKHALVGTVRALAFELAPDIRVNAVAPGATRTTLGGLESAAASAVSLQDIAGLEDMVAKTVPLGFLSEPEDHAGLYLTLADSQQSRFVTAAIIPSDGGLEVRGGGRRHKSLRNAAP
ncbi:MULTISPECIES: 3-(cis-5,6-dihydroxycyclohexa-1,3-dien-1-yl)propanoate dehydrogenase [unclassified Beijerinckia]|uniref:3-(cis-5,6-dihydroxycyclohexa-1, 3-dien-1-yl)propanoate dehydrogenase n=1 Tax=unclassified Beijerinckia TaxID=2638183 RepID=UPI000894F20E|nr:MULTISPECIES: 3-(cis-5,6-dihydroxycyclohexa-1,3-dien-1-yl)propanoate dehydrogenase [unclassified Beijerinckia]MDH7799039.1 NAD(P)-dependent dehydrogenase (short-subunit alcohol dehydrogenase family) [Beijerinckia sp. GAS462]SED97026.1 NAD(P)-dependent dehydrogenase, short-chain alcohol dehydrogenase family [Beijerinckia sp. 28-YEA-48]